MTSPGDTPEHNIQFDGERLTVMNRKDLALCWMAESLGAIKDGTYAIATSHDAPNTFEPAATDRILSGLVHLGLKGVEYKRAGVVSAAEVRMLFTMAKLGVDEIISDPA